MESEETPLGENLQLVQENSVSVTDFNLRELLPLPDTRSYKNLSFDELGPIQVIMTVFPIFSTSCRGEKEHHPPLLEEQGIAHSSLRRQPMDYYT